MVLQCAPVELLGGRLSSTQNFSWVIVLQCTSVTKVITKLVIQPLSLQKHSTLGFWIDDDVDDGDDDDDHDVHDDEDEDGMRMRMRRRRTIGRMLRLRLTMRTVRILRGLSRIV